MHRRYQKHSGMETGEDLQARRTRRGGSSAPAGSPCGGAGPIDWVSSGRPPYDIPQDDGAAAANAGRDEGRVSRMWDGSVEEGEPAIRREQCLSEGDLAQISYQLECGIWDWDDVVAWCGKAVQVSLKISPQDPAYAKTLQDTLEGLNQYLWGDGRTWHF